LKGQEAANTLVLLGQPDLAHKLRFAPYEALYQRIAVRYQLPPFDLEETAGYIKHHLRSVLCIYQALGRSNLLPRHLEPD
jgi:type II secretory pathway predicted ATPase ExeA